MDRPLSVKKEIFEGVGFQQAFRDFDPGSNLTALEVCCGEGRAILELQGLMPRSNLHCMNNPAYSREALGANLSGEQKDLEPIIERYKIQMRGHTLPAVFFGDASAQAWLFSDGLLDIIYSTFCMTRTFNLAVALSESKRTLAPGGEAFLHVEAVDSDRQHPPWHKQDLCSEFGEGPPRVLYCNSGHDFTLIFYAVYAHTERKIMGQQMEKYDHHGVLHLVKGKRECPTYKAADATYIDCFGFQAITFETVKAWGEFQNEGSIITTATIRTV